MPPTREAVLDALRSVRYPGLGRDIVSCGVVSAVHAEGGELVVEFRLGAGESAHYAEIERAALAAIRAAIPGSFGIRFARATGEASPSLRMAGARPSTAAVGALDRELIPGVRHVVAVASGKGGVGKSTVAVNLAVALARRGARTGLLDADVYGPSIPLMMGVNEPPRLTAARRILPFERFGVRFMSLGFLVDPGSAVIWRGPMVMKAIEQLLRDVAWGDLDVLVVDLPPGTGDAQLTLSQKIRLAGAVIVTTPQDVALADAIKGVAMFRKVGVPILGLVENMSYFVCPHCSGRSEIFGHGGGRDAAGRLEVPFLGEVPLEPGIRVGGDTGRPVVDEQPTSAHAGAFLSIADRVREALGDGADHAPRPPREGLLERFRGTFGSRGPD